MNIKSYGALRLHVLFAILISSSISFVATGEEVNTNAFVVYSEVSSDQQSSSSQSIFVGTKVYSGALNREHSLKTLFDLDQRTVRIVDCERKIQTSVTFREISEFQSHARARATKIGGVIAFMANPNFSYRPDPTSKTIRLESKDMTYSATVDPGAADVVDRYMEFADWRKQLDTYLHKGHPATARMQLNRKLRENSFLARRVALEVGKAKAASQHQYKYSLDKAQQDFIAETENQLKIFPQTSFSEFANQRNLNRTIVKK